MNFGSVSEKSYNLMSSFIEKFEETNPGELDARKFRDLFYSKYFLSLITPGKVKKLIKLKKLRIVSEKNVNLNQQIEKTFKMYEAEIEGITEEIRKKANFQLNSLDESKFSEGIKELQPKVENSNVSNWLGLVVVWMRVPKEPRYHDLYKNLV